MSTDSNSFSFAQLSDPHLSTLDNVRWYQLLSKRWMGYLSWLKKRRHEHRAEVLAAHPELPDDSPTGSNIMESVDEYALVLEQLDLSLADEQVAKKFPLWNIVEVNDSGRTHANAIEAHLSRVSSSQDGEESEQ